MSKMIRRFGLVGFLPLAAVGIAACDGGAVTSSTFSPAATSSALDSIRVTNASQIPTCSPINNGQVVFVTSDNQIFYCNGSTAKWVATGLNAPAAGANGKDGVNGTNGTAGATGHAALVRVTSEPSGNHCSSGGERIDVGVDADDSGALSDSEVSGTVYVCDGVSGAVGASGINGTKGRDGTNGVDGSNGATGATGADGVSGANGNTGATGPTGATGATGATGSTGADGVTGSTGPTGADGATGATGGTSNRSRIVFVTASDYAPNWGGLAGADSICATEASMVAGLSGKVFKAWLSDSTGSPSTRFTQDGAFYLADGTTKIADSWAQLTGNNPEAMMDPGSPPAASYSLYATINKTASASEITNDFGVPEDDIVWSSTNYDGTYFHPTSFGSCLDWTNTQQNNGGQDSAAGYTGDRGNGWTVIQQTGCQNVARLYCFEQ